MGFESDDRNFFVPCASQMTANQAVDEGRDVAKSVALDTTCAGTL